MIEFITSVSNQGILRVVPPEEEYAIGIIEKLQKNGEYCFQPIAQSFFLDELKQIVNKLEELNGN